jgi:hypothetical protein
MFAVSISDKSKYIPVCWRVLSGGFIKLPTWSDELNLQSKKKCIMIVRYLSYTMECHEQQPKVT